MSDKSNQDRQDIQERRGFVPRLNFFSQEGVVIFLVIVIIVAILFGIIFVLNGYSFDITF